ncbi:hypothetical protein SLS60_003526 [Paraconiothyrium brasiliense]|uniref:Myb-like domain-containing protein n=1 Tax=Paraconiothyrium brasiliense TaxID=300254 RepID=A0ABR3RVZ8_9PLEO
MRTQDVSGAPNFRASQLGVTVWTPSEKEAFFNALERLGKDNLPGIASAVGSKSILETRQFLLLLDDARLDRPGKRDISLEDIPAASEIGVVCERQLDAAGDTLACMQERFEATQEQKRYGEHWLLTSELADEIEVAAKGLRASVTVESGDDEDRLDAASDPPLLQEIPEAKLIIPKSFLELSRHVFMNPSPDTSYPWPNWQDLASDVAAEPCMYRTAFRDFHTLVLSFTKRVMQIALVQATSRVRAQGWRIKKGVKLFVRSRDVYTALDLLGVKRTRRQFFRDVPRRCRLRITDGKYRKTRSLRWDEVERILDAAESKSTPVDSDTDAESRDAKAERMSYKPRAARSGTPLPPARRSSPYDSLNADADANAESLMEDTDSDAYQPIDESLDTSDAHAERDEESIYNSSEDELEALEEFDREISRLEESRLWSILGDGSLRDQGPKLEPPSERPIRRIPRRRNMLESDDWRTWTQYQPECEQLRSRIPTAIFLANQKPPSPSRNWDPATDYGAGYGTETGASSGEDRKSRNRPIKRTVQELPLRDARSYAALRGRQSRSAERETELDITEDSEIPAQSIEDVNEGTSAMSLVEEDVGSAMQWT